MSSLSFLPSRGAESAVYLAFSLILSAAILNAALPRFAQTDPAAYASILILETSLTASVLFYIKPERLVDVFLQGTVDRVSLQQFVARVMLVTRPWEVSVYRILSPQEEADYIIRTLDNEHILHADIWVMKGGCYFWASIVLLPYLVQQLPPLSFLLPAFLEAILMMSVYLRYRLFPVRVRKVLLARYLEDALLADKTVRRTGPVLDNTKDEQVQKEIEYKEHLISNLGDIIRVLDRKEWDRFEKRFDLMMDALHEFSNRRLETEGYSEIALSLALALAGREAVGGVSPWTRFDNQRVVLQYLYTAGDYSRKCALATMCAMDKNTPVAEYLSSLDLQCVSVNLEAPVANLIATYCADINGHTEKIGQMAGPVAVWLGGPGSSAELSLRILHGLPMSIQKPLVDEVASLLEGQAVSGIKRALHFGDFLVSKMAARVLGSFNEETLVRYGLTEELGELVRLSGSDVGVEALSSLVRMGAAISDARMLSLLGGLERHGNNEMVWLLLRAIESRTWSEESIEEIDRMIVGLVCHNNPFIRAKAVHVLGQVHNEKLKHPHLPSWLLLRYYSLWPYRSGKALVLDPLSVDLLRSNELEKLRTSAAQLLEVDVRQPIQYQVIAGMLHANEEFLKSCGLYLLREHPMMGEIPEDLPKRVTDLLLDAPIILMTLAASVISRHQALLVPHLVERAKAENLYGHPGFILAMGSIGESLAAYPDVVAGITKNLNSITDGANMSSAIALSSLGRKVKEYLGVVAAILSLLKNESIRGLYQACLLETAGALFDRLELPELEKNYEHSGFTWIHDIGFSAKMKILSREQEKGQ